MTLRRLACLAALPLILVASCDADDTATPKPSAPASSVLPPPTPAPPPFSGPTGYAVFQALSSGNSTAGDACPDGVHYDDAACGAQLRSFNATAASVVDILDGRYDDPQSKAVLKAAKDVVDAYSTVAGSGCFHLPATGKKSSAEGLAEVCPTMSQLVKLSYFALESAVRS